MSYLPFVVLYCGVDVLVQQLLGLQLMNAESFEQLSDLLALQGLQTAQQRRVNHADIPVQGRNCSWKRITHTKATFPLRFCLKLYFLESDFFFSPNCIESVFGDWMLQI